MQFIKINKLKPVSGLSGFTLIELMVTLAVVAILATIAIPSFETMIKDNRLSSQANELISSLNFARSEAVKRGASITVSKTGANWNNGWQIADAGSNVIRSHSAFSGTSTLTSGTTSITFRGSGFVQGGSVNFNLCDDRSGETGRYIQISTTGRVSVSRQTCS